MRNLIFVFVILAMFSYVFAQNDDNFAVTNKVVQGYAGGGINTNVYLVPIIGVHAHGGYYLTEDTSMSIRAALDVNFIGPLTILRLAPDFIYQFSEDGVIAPYIGIGPRLLIASLNTDVQELNGAGTLFGAGVIIGTEYIFTPEIALFVEGGTDLQLVGPLVLPTFSASIGVNYRF